MTHYKPGTRVRVTFDAFVTSGSGLYGEYRVSEDTKARGEGIAYAWVRPEHMERLPDPEPDWQPGDVVRAADGGTYARGGYAPLPWFALTVADSDLTRLREDRQVPRPLTPLVRGGKPWGET